MRRILIEFCISNLANGAQRAREVLERDYNFDIIEYGCLVIVVNAAIVFMHL